MDRRLSPRICSVVVSTELVEPMMLGNCEYLSPGYVVIDPWVTGLPMQSRSLLSIHKHFVVGLAGLRVSGERAWRCWRFLCRLLGWLEILAGDRGSNKLWFYSTGLVD